MAPAVAPAEAGITTGDGRTVAGLVLAAGAGRRLGRPKVDLAWAGSTLLERARAGLLAGGCDPVLAVVPPGHPGGLPNPDWAQGMGSSLRLGLARLGGDRGADAVVVTLVDTPVVGAQHVGRLLAAWRAGARVAVATYDGRPRTPVLLGREHWTEVGRLAEGDVGARPFLAAHPHLVTPVECGDLGPWADVDTPADLPAAAARARWVSGRGSGPVA